MNLFERRSTAPPVEHIQQIKRWVNDLLSLGDDVPISISQLRCHEPDCPPAETVISVMTQPTQTYKIHQSAAEVDYDAVAAALPSSAQ
ncbi:hypothetical protein C1752_01572 [Acaryochloris thomasi RCC1774]|uniref:Nitrate reductase n=1 Tax=Acaryochloris thomasi RCC1774 TaxID=1764569 RepID=A0A2W1JKX7_9CYAN|nr:hypothetical protein [Acaryochloris thomasi]PZD74028.1 hypothetical protein C1752_01572 [Acaryochloris thomasi RCC1774]